MGRPTPTDFQFRPIDRAALWARLRLDRTDLVRLTGLSRRQIGYWERNGLIEHGPDSRFSMATLERVLLIKQALDAGFPLAVAVQLVNRYQAESPPTNHLDWDVLRRVSAGLDRVEEALRALRHTLGE